MKKLLVIAAAVAFTGSTFAQSAPATQTAKTPAPAKKEAAPAPAKKEAAPAPKKDATATTAAPAKHTEKKKSSTHHTAEKKATPAPAAAPTK